jgi:hypothetical protein
MAATAQLNRGSRRWRGGREGARCDVIPLLHLRRAGPPEAGLTPLACESRRELDHRRGASRKEEEEAGEEEAATGEGGAW